MSYSLVVPTYHAHFWCVLRLAKSIRKFVTDADNFKFLVVTTDDRETAVLQDQLNDFVPGSTAQVVSYRQILKDLRFNATPEIFDNVHRRQHFRHNYQSLKKLCAAVYADTDQVFTMDSESLFFRETSIWGDIVKPYLDNPRHFSYVSQSPFLRDLRLGAGHLLRYNADALQTFNFEYQDWILEKDLLTGFLTHISDSWSCSNFFDAVSKAFFQANSLNGVFFEIMAYRYYLEQQQLHTAGERLMNYQFLDSFDAFGQCMSDAVLAATKPAEHPVEHLGNWLSSATFDGIQNFFRTFGLCMMRLELHYPHPWAIRQFIKETPELKLAVCSPNYDLFL